MISGSATGYVAKYVAKNIDDEGVGFHLDDYADGAGVARELKRDRTDKSLWVACPCAAREPSCSS